MLGDIFQRICEGSQVVDPPTNQWSFLRPSSDVRRLEGDPMSLIGALRGEFTDEQFVESRIAYRGGEGELYLTPILTEPNLEFISLRRGKEEAPYELVSKHGSLINEQPPCFVADHDYLTHAWLPATKKVLFVAGEMLDAAILRMLHLSVTVAAGLDSLNGQQLRMLCGPPQAFQKYHGHKIKRQQSFPRADICRRVKRLALVGWDVAQMRRQVPAGLAAIVQRITDAQQVFDFDVSNICVWQPSSSVIAQIRLGAELRDRELVRSSILSSLETSLFKIDDFHHVIKPKAEPPKLNYCVARRELLAARKLSAKLHSTSRELLEKLDKLNDAFEQTVIEPLLKDAASTSDSVEAALLMSAAEVAERLHTTSPLVRSSQNYNSRGSNESNGEIDPEDMKQRLCAINHLINLHKELRGK